MIDASEPPWLELARADLGVCEAPGPKSNPVIKRYFADAGHPEVEDDSETAWCAAASCSWLRRAGMPVPPKSVSLMAMSFESYGAKLDSFRPGAICVFYRTARREKDWRRHVGIGVKETKTHVHIIGGNQGNAVSEQRFAKRDLVAMRWPVAATVRDLREAGSTDIATADAIKKVAIAAGGVATTGAAANQATQAPAPVVPVVPDVSLTQATEQLTAVKMFMEGANAVASLVFAHPWLAAGLVVAVGGYVIARRIERNRVHRAELGHALSRAG